MNHHFLFLKLYQLGSSYYFVGSKYHFVFLGILSTLKGRKEHHSTLRKNVKGQYFLKIVRTEASCQRPRETPHALMKCLTFSLPACLCFFYFINGQFLPLPFQDISGLTLLFSLWNTLVQDITDFCLVCCLQSLSPFAIASALKSTLLSLT